jgi:hypothetical protein
MQHRRDNDGGKRRLWHVPEKRRQENQRKKTKNCCDEISELATSAGGQCHRGLGQAADHRKSTEQAAENIGRPMRDQFLIWIDVTPTLGSCSLCRTE